MSEQSYYLDSNFFVYLFTQEEDILKKIINNLGKHHFYTSCLTYDEVVWVIRKLFGKEISIKSSGFLLSISNLNFINVDKEILHKTDEVISYFDLKPRDSLHYASMENNNIKNIVTDDKDFNKIKIIEVISIESFVKQLTN